MASKTDPANLDNAIQLYLSGEPLEKICATTGVTQKVLTRERIARRIPPRRVHKLPVDAIVAAYLAGASEYALGRQYGVSRNVIGRRLEQAGVERRTSSEAGIVRASRMTADERKRQAAAANRAARLRQTPRIEKLRHALTVEQKAESGSACEELLWQMMAERDRPMIKQRAIGPYNVDLAHLPVAVEVLGGGWHAIKSAHAERTPYILDEGWHLVMVWDYEGRSALSGGAADYLVAFMEEMRWNPPATCQYRVIGGGGEVLAARGREDDEFPLVPPPRGGA